MVFLLQVKLLRLNNIISKNDGIRQFSILTNNCYDSDQGFDDSQQTHIRITNAMHDINQLGETYLRMTFEAECTFSAGAPTSNNGASQDCTNIPIRFFLGWKNSNECLKQLEVENMNIDTNYLQTECAKEGFAYSTYKPREEKMSRRYVHTRFSDVDQYKDGVCGTYFGCDAAFLKSSAVNMSTDGLANAQTDHKTTFPSTFTVKNIQVILPITDILAFQCFEDFPGGLGDIVLKIFFNKDSMVWAPVDPYAVNTSIVYAGGTGSSLIKQGAVYDRTFYQVGQGGEILNKYTHNAAPANEGSTNKVTKFSVNKLTCTRCQCECYGYNVTQECKRQLVSLFTPSNPYFIPAQQIDIKYFANKIDSKSHYTSDFTYALHNVTDFVIVFPENTTNITTFKNPMATNVQLRVDGKLYPNQPFESTCDHRFYTAMMNASDLQSFFEPDNEYRDSLLVPRRKDTDSEPYTKFQQDISSFLLTMQAERNSGGYFFDGLETGNQNVNIQIQFDNAIAGAAPQVWFTRDTYWTVDNENGLRYWKTGTPAAYASVEDATVS